MRFRSIFLLVALLLNYSIVNASMVSIDCLTKIEPKGCFVDLAFKELLGEKNPSRSAEGFAALLNALTKANIRRDDIFTASNLGSTKKIDAYLQWSLAMSRKNYLTRFRQNEAGAVSNADLERLAVFLQGRSKLNKSMDVIITACDIRDEMADESKKLWDGVLDRLCSIDDSSSSLTNNPFSMLYVPLVNAYNHDEISFEKSVTMSFHTLNLIEEGLKDKKITKNDRDSMYGLLFAGHILNASALSLLNRQDSSVIAANEALEFFDKAKGKIKSHDLLTVIIQAAWIYAKADRDVEAKQVMKSALLRLGESNGGDLAIAYSMCIETYSAMKNQRVLNAV